MNILGFQLMKFQSLLLAGGIAMVAAAAPAHAVMATQTVGPVSFSTSGTAASTSTTPTSFPGFNTSLGTLTGVKITNAAGNAFVGTFSGNGAIGNLFGSTVRTYTLTAFPTFSFSNSSSVAGTPAPVTISPNSLPPNALTALSGNYSGTTTSVSTNTPILKSYFSGTPAISSYVTNYTFTSSPTGGLSTVEPEGATWATFSGNIWLTYEYDAAPAAQTPGPLPLLGAGAAFMFSRKLRRRIQSSAA
jgi:hypothetical protein